MTYRLARIDSDDCPALLDAVRTAERRDDLVRVRELCTGLVALFEWRPVWRIALRYLIRATPSPEPSCRHATIERDEGWKRCYSCGVMWLASEPPPPVPNGSPELGRQSANVVRLLTDIAVPQCPQPPPRDLEAAVGDAPLGDAVMLLYVNALKVWSPRWFEWLARESPRAAQHIIADIESYASGSERAVRQGPVRMWTPCPTLPKVPARPI